MVHIPSQLTHRNHHLHCACGWHHCHWIQPKQNWTTLQQLKSKWEITKLGEPRLALGITISCNHEELTISIYKTNKIDQLMDKYGQQDVHSVNTSMIAGLQLWWLDNNATLWLAEDHVWHSHMEHIWVKYQYPHKLVSFKSTQRIIQQIY